MSLGRPIDSASRHEVVDVSAADHEFQIPVREIRALTAGNAVFRLEQDGADMPVLTLAAGERLPFAVRVVRRAGTTATLIGFA